MTSPREQGFWQQSSLARILEGNASKQNTLAQLKKIEACEENYQRNLDEENAKIVVYSS